MEKQISNLLSKELIGQIEKLSRLGSGTKEKASAVEDVTKLYRLKLEEEKIISESQLNAKERELKCEQLRKESVSRQVQLGVQVTLFIAQLCFYSHWARKGFEFEKNGCFTSSTLKNLFNRFKFKS